MTRKLLCTKIKTASLRLNNRHKNLQLAFKESDYLIKQINPLFLIGTGFISGAAINLIGFKKVVKLVSICRNTYPFITNFTHLFINKNLNE